MATALALGAIGRTTTPARAHTKPRAAREIVRVQGTVHAIGLACTNEITTLDILNRNIQFCASETRRIAVTTTDVSPNHTFPTRYSVQGERSELARILAAKAGERLTILAEWRPGRSDLFLIALDVCSCPESGASPVEKEPVKAD